MILNSHPGEKLDEVAKRLARGAKKAKGKYPLTTTYGGIELVAQFGDDIESIMQQYNEKLSKAGR